MLNMILRFFEIIFLIDIIKSGDFSNTSTRISNITFKDYIERFRPCNVWREVEENNKRIGLNKTLNDEFDKIYNLMDKSEELLKLNVKNGDPKILLQKDGRRWIPPGNVETNNKHDPFNLRRRLLELMKQAIYQARRKMVTMQVMREKYNKISVYKMGFLIGKTDRACKTFAAYTYKAFRACSMSREHAISTHALIDILDTHERMLDLWFDVDLLIDLVEINHRNCQRMLNQVLTNRKHAWKFID